MIRKDCYFYAEWYCIGTTMNSCRYLVNLTDSKTWFLEDNDNVCDDCPYHISRQTVDEMIRNYIKERIDNKSDIKERKTLS